MNKEQRKEKLTRANIRKDIQKVIRKASIQLLLLILLLVVMVGGVIALLREGVWITDGMSPFMRSRTVVGYLVIGPVIVMAGVWLFHLIRGVRKDLFITTDKLVSAEYDDGNRNGTTTVTLHFNENGDYIVPVEPLHPWSELYPLSPMGEYYHATAGDEYYVVLSKPHSGKILMVYNKDLFELVD